VKGTPSKIALTLLFLFTALNLSAQHDAYLYSRIEGESAKAFVQRHFGEYEGSMQQHDPIEGFWGDESKGKKIMAFYSGFLEEDYYEGTMLIFQPVGDNKNYILSLYKDLNNPGRYYEGVISVFFMDVDNDGYKELFLIEKGGVRVPVTIEHLGDDGEIIAEETTACCEYEYTTEIIRQLKNDNRSFLSVYAYHEIMQSLELNNFDNAVEVKQAVREYLNK
jgi:hypothetical protein